MTDKKKVTTEQLIQVIGALGDAFNRDAELKHSAACANYIKEYGEMLLDPENFGLLVTFDLEQLQDILSHNLISAEQNTKGVTYTQEQFHALQQLMMNYATIEQQLDVLIVKYEGSPCSADKTRYILNLYRDFIVTGEEPSFGERCHYWIPKKGTCEAWLNFTKSISPFLHGQVDEYFKTRDILVSQLEEETTAQKQTQHDVMTKHPFYLSDEQKVNRFNKVEQVYTFNNEDELLTIHQQASGEWQYRLKVDNQRYSYKEQEQGLFPEWVTALFSEL